MSGELIKVRSGGKLLLDCGENGFIETGFHRFSKAMETGRDIQEYIQLELAYKGTKRFKTLEEGLAHFERLEEEWDQGLEKDKRERKNQMIKKQGERTKKSYEKKKRGRPTKEERRDRKLRDALKEDARLVEMSLSKLLWDFAGKKVVVSGNQRLDYQIIWALHCASDFIARDEWADRMMDSPEREKHVFRDEKGRYLVTVPYKKFKKFIGRDITVGEAKEIFDRIPDVTLSTIGDGITLPFGGEWEGPITFYKDNICGVAFAKQVQYEEYRSDKTIERGRSAGTEEPVFILLFSNNYGIKFVEGAKKRWGTRLQYSEMYRVDPRAQELFESVRWYTGIVICNMEKISRATGWKWPITGKQQIYKRKRNCQRLIDILYENGFITKPRPRGRGEKSEWLFFIRKVKKALAQESGENIKN